MGMPDLKDPSERTTTLATPPLENGDHLTRAEFERRYDAMPGLKKAELIRGVVYMASPVRHAYHASPHFRLIGWLNYYTAATPGVDGGDNGTLRLGDDDEPQPDAYLLLSRNKGGRARLDAAGYVIGSPEWVGEVAASSASIDLHEKFEMYAEFGVQEYLVWRVLDNAFDWYVLKDGQFTLQEPDADGIHRSHVFPGLWLDPKALIAGDMKRVFQVVDQGVQSAEHKAFVAPRS